MIYRIYLTIWIMFLMTGVASAQNIFADAASKAVREGNPRVCEDLRQSCTGQSDCSGMILSCYTHYAEKRSDVSACSYLQQPIHRNSCYQMYAIKKLDIRACEKLKTSEGVRAGEYGKCVIGVQQKAKNFSLNNCLKLRDYDNGLRFDDCLVFLGRQTKDTSICYQYAHLFPPPESWIMRCKKMVER